MGQVYLAREPLTDTQVAIKIMKPQAADDPQAVHRFLTEARHMYRLAHPRILRVLEVSDRPAGPYYVMPYIAGGSLLGQYRPGQPLPADRAAAIARQVAEALAHAHSHGLIHRDLKPGNVLLDKDGNAYLTDFGLVRTLFNDSMVDATASHLEGTAPYMSPAVARGEAEDTRCDIYAFGALLYELLTGQPPYSGRTPQIILDQVLKGPPAPLREVNPKASPALVKIAEGCMARELRDRYASMGDVVAELERVAQGKSPIGTHGKVAAKSKNKKAMLAVGVVALIGLGAFGISRIPGSKISGTAPIGSNTPPSTSSTVGSVTGAVPMQIPFTCMNENGTVTITKYTGTGGNVTIPDEINGLPVTRIGENAFKSCSGLTSVAIPDSITAIGSGAFAHCVGLANVTLPDSITAIGSEAFKGCTGLTNVTLPNALLNSGDLVFHDCTSLRRIMIPAGVTSLGQAPFRACASLVAIGVDEANPLRFRHWGSGRGTSGYR